MKRTSARVLAALGFLVPLAMTVPSSAETPPLSEGCSTLHAGEQNTLTAQGTITITSTFTAGEQVRLTATGSSPSVAVAAPDGTTTFAPQSGDPVRYDVTATGPHTLTVTNQPSGPVSLTVACGIPPRAVVSAPAEGATYGVNEVVTPSVACVAGTNAPTCTPDSAGVDTSSAGAKSYRVVASDGSGLQTSTTVHYTVTKKAQTLRFTVLPPDDAVVYARYNYEIEAVSTSGLPVTLTSDPATPACHISPFGGGPIYGNLSTDQAGTCRIFADQPGNEEYLPAEQISYTFQVGRELTTLVASPASKGLLGLSGTTFKADLHYRGWFGPSYGAGFPYVDQKISFYVGGKLMCSATTVLGKDDYLFGGGIATCKVPIGVQAALKYHSYTAVYEGSRDYLPSTAIGKLQ